MMCVGGTALWGNVGVGVAARTPPDPDVMKITRSTASNVPPVLLRDRRLAPGCRRRHAAVAWRRSVHRESSGFGILLTNFVNGLAFAIPSVKPVRRVKDEAGDGSYIAIGVDDAGGIQTATGFDSPTTTIVRLPSVGLSGRMSQRYNLKFDGPMKAKP